MVDTILAGADAMRKAAKYLPQFPKESDADYKYRRENAKFTNIFRDLVEGLASKPFAKELGLVEGKATDQVKTLAEDIDGRGNHLHVFAGNVFFNGIAHAVDWIFVDHTKVPEGATRAQEKAIGARPYWVHIPATRMLAAYTDMIDGEEQFIHIRFREDEIRRSAFGETTVERVRVLNREPVVADGKVIGYAPATFELWEKSAGTNGKAGSWSVVDSGPIAIGIIALVPFLTGRRIAGSWQVLPPMKDCAHLQIEHYQQETNLKYARDMTCFPMLAGNGVTPEIDPTTNQPVVAPVGPKAVLYAPMGQDGQHGEWKFIEISASSLQFLESSIDKTERQLRELGRQPLTAETGNLTVVTTAFAAQKGNSAVQAWAINLKDALEQAWVYTCMWLKDSSEPEVSIHTDFAIEAQAGEELNAVLTLMERHEISREAGLSEMKRRNVLSPEYDAGADLDVILSEIPGDDDDGSAALPRPAA
ncbi:DUF4055 domain-containing protein [Pseudaminobacter salicylatoxidans]|uniref:DUF4055 domain-containing protein n=1 Tax=Pseudaminobacter salicylatoxidans TaxID=93369 RepID=UPI0002F9EFBE|nr:DUF4055 domain-containing protein [Pseudaminobacter salicylatoxidans]